jgi:signal transduction histidine kinase/CheY-like chemotaxis protein
MAKKYSIFYKQLAYFMAISLVITSLGGFLYYRKTSASVMESIRITANRYKEDSVAYFRDAYELPIIMGLNFWHDSYVLDAFLSASKEEDVLTSSIFAIGLQKFSKFRSDLCLSIRFIDFQGRERIVVEGNRQVKQYVSLEEAPQTVFYKNAVSLFERFKSASTGSMLLEGPFLDKGRHTFFIGISKADPEAGGFAGVLMFHCHLSKYLNYISQLKIFQQPIVWVFSKEGKILWTPGVDVDEALYAENQTIKITKGNLVSEEAKLGINNDKFLQIKVVIPPEIYKKELTSPIWQTALLFLSSLVLSAVLAFFLSARISRPILVLTKVVQQVAQGDFNAKANITTRDEIEELANAFNHMTEEIERKKKQELVQQEALKLVNRQLEETSKHKSEFLANMSHELRTPLNAMIGYTSVVLKALEDTIPPKYRQYLLNANQASQTLLGLINDVLDFSKIEAGKMEVFIDTFPIADVLEECIITAKGLLATKSVELKTDLPENLPIIESDSIKLKQIIHNLLSNAIKFTEKGYVLLQVSVIKGEDAIYVRMEDTGCGIPEDKVGSLFESFKQIDSSIKKRFGGTGLGLAISKRFCDMLKIKIDVQSKLGQGTVFCLCIPIRFGSQKVEEKEKATEISAEKAASPVDAKPVSSQKIEDTSRCKEPEEIQQSKSSEKITIVKEESQAATTRQSAVLFPIESDRKALVLLLGSLETFSILNSYLAQLPFELQMVNTKEECIEQAKRVSLWAIIVESMGDGFVDLAYFKDNPATHSIPIILCFSAPEKAVSSLGVVECITKPIKNKQLIETLLRITRLEKADILVVEDDQATLDLYAQVLSEARYTLHLAKNGLEALEILRKGLFPQAVLLDLLMPDMDGFQVLEYIQKDKAWKRIPIVVLSGKDLSKEEREILQKGAYMLLEKGKISLKTVSEHIESIIRALEVAHSGSLLVVDDNEMNLNLISGFFEDKGYTVYQAKSGQEGIDLAIEKGTDVVLMDLAMPGMDGFDATRILKQHPAASHVSVIACSAFSMMEFKQRAFEAGCAGFISKPIEPENLVEQVKRIVLADKIKRRTSK